MSSDYDSTNSWFGYFSFRWEPCLMIAIFRPSCLSWVSQFANEDMGLCRKRIDLSSGSWTNRCPHLEGQGNPDCFLSNRTLVLWMGVELPSATADTNESRNQKYSVASPTVRETERRQRQESSADNQRMRMDCSPEGAKDLSLNLWVNSHFKCIWKGETNIIL